MLFKFKRLTYGLIGLSLVLGLVTNVSAQNVFQGEIVARSGVTIESGNLNLQGNVVDFNQGRSKIYDNGDMHIATDNGLYLDGQSVYIRNYLKFLDEDGDTSTISRDRNGRLQMITDEMLVLHSPHTRVSDDLYVGHWDEFITNSNFDVNGNDLYVHGDAGVRGNIYSNNCVVTGSTTSYCDESMTSSGNMTLKLGNSGSNNFKITDGSGNTLFQVTDNGTTGDATLTGDLMVNGDGTFGGNLDVAGDSHLMGELLVDGPVTLSDTLEVDGFVMLNDDLEVAGDTFIGGELEVDDDAFFNDDVDISDSLDVFGNLYVDSNTELNGTLTVNDEAFFLDNVQMDEDLTVFGTANFDEDINVTNNANIGGNLDVDGTTNLDGDVTLGNDLDVTGDATVGEDLDVTNNTSIGGDLDVTGSTTLDGQTTINDNLIVNGDTEITGTLTVDTIEVDGPPIEVDSGGTGNSSFTTNGVLYGNGTNPILTTLAPTAGQVLLGNGSGVPTFTTISGDITISGTGVATIQPNSVALGTDTTGDYVAGATSGSGITVTGSGGEGSTPSFALGPLTSDWNQTGAFDIVLNNANSELRILESAGDTFFGTIDVTDLTSDQTYTLPDQSGTIALLSDISGASDHGSLTGLGDDDHLQYLLLAGRSGGQTAFGGTDANDDLFLRSTSDLTKGNVIIADDGGLVGIGINPTNFDLEVDGNVGPASNDTYNLGSDTLRWQDIYLGPGTMHIGTGTADEATLSFDTANDELEIGFNGGAAQLTVTDTGNVVQGTGALLASATNGFPYMPSVPSTPSGTPTSYAGRVPMTFDSTANILYVYNSGWQAINGGSGITGTGVAGRVTIWNGTSSVTSDAQYLYDSTANRLRIGTTPADSGAISLSNSQGLFWRNVGNTADMGVSLNNSDEYAFSQNGSSQVNFVQSAGGDFRFYAGSTSRANLAVEGSVSAYDSTTFGTLPATTGALRLPNASLINWRNTGDTANMGITLNNADEYAFSQNGSSQVNFVQSAGGDFRFYAGSTSRANVATEGSFIAYDTTTITGTPAATGAIRLPSGKLVSWRNGASSADMGITLSSADDYTFTTDSSGYVTLAVGSSVSDFRIFDPCNGGGCQADLEIEGTLKVFNSNDFGSTIASSGIVRLPNNQAINWRNAGDTADMGISVDLSDDYRILSDASDFITFSGIAAVNGPVFQFVDPCTGGGCLADVEIEGQLTVFDTNGLTGGGVVTISAAGIVPGSDDNYDLGSSASRFRDLYLGPTSLHIVSNAAETTTSREWELNILETGATEGDLRLFEGSQQRLAITRSGESEAGFFFTLGTGTSDLQISTDTDTSGFSVIRTNVGSGIAFYGQDDVQAVTISRTTSDVMIGDGTISSHKLTVIGSATEEGIYLNNTVDGVDLQISPDQDQPDFMTFRTTTGSGIIFHGQEDVSALVINATTNNLGTGGSCLDPDHDLIIGGSGAGCDTGTYSEIDAGEGSFTVSSSRTLKENFNLVSVPNILDLIAQVPVYTYDFKQSACSTGDCKDKMGLIAEDFHTIFGRGSDKQINGQEMTMALWLGMQALNNKVAQLEVTSIKADMDNIKLAMADIKGEITSIKADIAGIKDRLNNLEDTVTKKNVPVTEGATEYKVEWPTPFAGSDYGAWVTPNWITGFAIKEKKPDSFMILFEVPAPAGATIDYKAEK